MALPQDLLISSFTYADKGATRHLLCPQQVREWNVQVLLLALLRPEWIIAGIVPDLLRVFLEGPSCLVILPAAESQVARDVQPVDIVAVLASGLLLEPGLVVSLAQPVKVCHLLGVRLGYLLFSLPAFVGQIKPHL